MELNVTLEHRDARDYVSPPYNLDQPPSYYVLVVLFFRSFLRQYLKEWGPNWQREAPQRFVYLDRFQSELFPEGNRRVRHSQPGAPANSTIGYDDLSYLTVTKSERQRNQVVRRSGRSGETANRWLHQDRDRGRSQTDRTRRSSGNLQKLRFSRKLRYLFASPSRLSGTPGAGDGLRSSKGRRRLPAILPLAGPVSAAWPKTDPLLHGKFRKWIAHDRNRGCHRRSNPIDHVREIAFLEKGNCVRRDLMRAY